MARLMVAAPRLVDGHLGFALLGACQDLGSLPVLKQVLQSLRPLQAQPIALLLDVSLHRRRSIGSLMPAAAISVLNRQDANLREINNLTQVSLPRG